jgi:hypothetical protein
MLMRRIVCCLLAVGLFGAVAGVRGDEEKVPLDKLPKAIKEAVKKRFPKADLVSAGKEKEGGKTVYEVTLKEAGLNIDVTATPDGTITTIEKQIKEKDLPEKVSAALAKKYPRATYKIIEEVWKVKGGKETMEYYEALLVTAEKKKLEVTVTAEGKITKEEDKSKEKE